MKLPLLLLAVSALYFNASPTEDNPHLFKRLFKACTNFNWKKRNNDLTNRGCACSKPRPKRDDVVVDGCACSKPRPKDVDVSVSDACACSKPRPKRDDVVVDGCACSKPRPKDADVSVSDGCACSKPRPKRDDVVVDGCACSKPRPKDVDVSVSDGCACSKPRPKKQELLNNICKLIIKKQHAFPIHQVQYVSIKPQDIPQEPNKIDGGELFVACAENFVKIIHGGVVANNSGKLENGLPYIFNGINGLVQIVSRTPNPEQTLEEVIKFMQEFDNNDYEQLLTIAKSHVTD
ncbi:MAG: hypothetical protein US32_C0001G0093 [candidate division TM6 bacterium GW2011_GWA2_36_9]|nr:MAG: hypothetical protein US32_C0001G0093 [candidate division TM6 bacterium GW2011_GWA2_36_9]